MTQRSRWTALLLAAAAAVACSDIASPLRSDFYEWRIIAPSPSGTGEDTISFHWQQSDLPVRVWVEDGAGLPDHMRRAIDVWKSEFLYHEFDGTEVSDSSTADIIVLASSAPSVKDVSPAVTRLHSALAPECSGETRLQISDDHTQLLLPFRVYINPLGDPTAPAVADCLALTSIHELGHTLGIFQHSPDSTDIMFELPVVPLPSERDRNTAEVIYHLPSTLQAVHP
jgi:hypothetical protein